MSIRTPDIFTLKSVSAAFSEYLSQKAVDSPRLSAELIIGHVLGLSRLDMIIRPERPVSQQEWAAMASLVERRGRGEPVAYLLGVKEFFGRDFTVTPDTLIPRPETEHIIEELVSRFQGRAFRFADLGTGSGCIAVTLCAELPLATGVAVDLSEGALHVARENAQNHGVSDRLQFVRGDFTSSLFVEPAFDCIATNPPYVSEQEYAGLSNEVKDFEPRTALVPGESGLEHARLLFRNGERWLHSGGIFIMEMGFWQAEPNLMLCSGSDSCWRDQIVIKDLAGLSRHILAVRT